SARRSANDRGNSSPGKRLWSWGFIAPSLLCLCCILGEGILALRHVSSTSQFFENLFLATLVLNGWGEAFRFRTIVFRGEREQGQLTELAIERAPAVDKSKPSPDAIAKVADRSVNRILWYAAIAILVLQGQIIFLLRHNAK